MSGFILHANHFSTEIEICGRGAGSREASRRRRRVDQKNHSGDAQDEVREMTDRIRWSGARIENTGNGVVLRSCGAQRCGEKHAREENGNTHNPADDRWPIRLLHCLDDPHQESPLRT